MKLIIPTLSVLGIALLSGCAGTNQNSIAGSRIGDPYIPEEVNAHLDLSNRVSGTATVETYQILFVKFNAGGQESRVGNVGNRLTLKEGVSLNPFELLFKSPADKQAAVDAAYFEAVENGNCDALINTKVRLHTDGYSILGLFGYGTASAAVDAYGLNITKGPLPAGSSSRKKAEARSFIEKLFGSSESAGSNGSKDIVQKKAPAKTSAPAPNVAKSKPQFVQDGSGTTYLASAVGASKSAFGR